jgi:hypothetical protein
MQQGIGSIPLKLHDGTIRVLTDARYVPDLKKNIISLGAFDAKGYTITMSGGVLKVVVRRALVVLKGSRKGSLYGSTVTGRASVSVSSDENDASRLWHMRLEHAGEKALQGLVKQGLLKGDKTGKVGFSEHCVLGKQTRVKFVGFIVPT